MATGSRDDPRDGPGELDFSIRLKYGKHTIFMFIDPLAPFTSITDELLETLRERYPDGLSPSHDSPTKVPLNEDVQVAYAVLRNPAEPSQGWKNLDIAGSETPVDKGLKNNCVVAFVLRHYDADQEPSFEVEWPKLDDPVYA